MTRPVRIEFENACYHVINRGNRREQVFFNDDDYQLFIFKLVEFAEVYDVVIHSYCLIPNHFHLQLRTKQANLGKFMQVFLTSFTLIMNRKYGKSGHLFQGRYKAYVIDSGEYKNKLSRYIHLNPVKIKSLEHLELSRKKQLLHDYKWSSFRYYIGIAKKPDWLNRNYVLSSWGNKAQEKMANYREYVEKGMLTDNTLELFPELQSVIGTDSFVDKIKKTYLKRDTTDLDDREQPIISKVNSISIDEILEKVRLYYKLETGVLLERNCNHTARKVAMFLAVKYCRKNESLSSIAKQFGIKISALNMARGRFQQLLKRDRELNKQFMELDGIIKLK